VTHWTVVPIVLPAMMAAFIVLVLRHQPLLQRVFSLAGTVVLLAVAAGLMWRVSDGTVLLYQLGNWAAPFGIVLAVDRLAALFVTLTALLSVFVALYAGGSGCISTRSSSFS